MYLFELLDMRQEMEVEKKSRRGFEFAAPVIQLVHKCRRDNKNNRVQKSLRFQEESVFTDGLLKRYWYRIEA